MSKTYKDSRNAKADRDPRKVVHFKPIKFKHDEQDWDSQLDELLNSINMNEGNNGESDEQSIV
jgi:hypothetical protein